MKLVIKTIAALALSITAANAGTVYQGYISEKQAYDVAFCEAKASEPDVFSENMELVLDIMTLNRVIKETLAYGSKEHDAFYNGRNDGRASAVFFKAEAEEVVRCFELHKKLALPFIKK